jgi:hypothetical protein
MLTTATKWGDGHHCFMIYPLVLARLNMRSLPETAVKTHIEQVT